MDSSSRLSEKARKFENEISPVSEILRYADLDDIPKGPTKKILYRELKKYYMEKHPIT